MSAPGPSRTLRTAFWNYDRTSPLIDGRIGIEDARLAIEVLRPEETFARAYQGDGFDLCEVSFSNSVTAISQNACPYVLVPAFLSRAFRHSAIYIRADKGIAGPEDLKGKAVGLQEYDMTAAVVVRGILRDSYGISPSDIRWKVGEAERLKPLEFPIGQHPADVSIEVLPPGATLEQRLLAGELDAMISLRVPNAFAEGDPLVRRLFADPVMAERAWFRETDLFPIMHAVGVRKELAARCPGLTRRIYEAFLSAKNLALADLAVTQAPKVTLPWPHAALADARSLMGDDPWPYGIAQNRHVLETQLRWSREDGLQVRPVPLAEIFAADCMDT
jgi:4,5-dihydroxyphthalate decarboxylase